MASGMRTRNAGNLPPARNPSRWTRICLAASFTRGGCHDEKKIVAPKASTDQMKVASAAPPAAFTGGGIGDWRSRIGVTVAEAVAGALMLGENSTIHVDLCDV